jgi:ATP-dependent RNA helicase DDX42
MDQKKGTKKFTFGLQPRKPAATSTANDTPKDVVDDKKRKATVESSLPAPKKRTIEADDEDDFLASAGIGKTKSVCIQSFYLHLMAAPPPASAVDDDDPLDAFMADITEQAKKPVAEPKVATK